ncbi:MAG: hypothetical protein RBR32_10305 [Bacteroidales bacterium]|nr:hypothetical protein [Bacteroidales bacterium]
MTPKEFLDYLEKNKVPPNEIDEKERGILHKKYYNDYSKLKAFYEIKYKIQRVNCMYALIDLKWTKGLADWIKNRKCLEIQAGVGWLAKALKHHGIDIIATDNYSWESIKQRSSSKIFPVFNMERTDAIDHYENWADILIISWPHFHDSEIVSICKKWSKLVIYIGEGNGGCCASEEFFDYFEELEDSPIIKNPSWEGVYDNVRIGTFINKKENRK